MKGLFGLLFLGPGKDFTTPCLLINSLKHALAVSLIVLATDSHLLSHQPVRALARIAVLLYLTGRPLDEVVFDRDKSGG